MDDEFALCWNNFQDNIATGFQNLYDRGDLVDVTLACDGKLLQAHKIVLAICSPYFQEMFITNPCKHPIIILKDVTYTVMSELLQFMYQGVVNVKHTDLSSFMKIAQALQIKGLATSAQKPSSSPTQSNNSISSKNACGNLSENFSSTNNVIETKINTALFSNKSDNLPVSISAPSSATGHKRPIDYSAEHLSIFPKKQNRRASEGGDNDITTDSMENMSSDEVFLPPIPQISMAETRFDLNNVKRETTEPLLSPGALRNLVPPPFNFDYNNSAYNKSLEYPNELHSGDYSKSLGASHMDIPAGGNITMLSSTSLLHGNCIFNRNNTVATQQGMKTYWLCKSYRITMCRARCITHQGRVISATGVHNHQPHMKGPPTHGSEFVNTIIQGGNSGIISGPGNPPLRLPSQNISQQPPPPPPPPPQHHLMPQQPGPPQHQHQHQHQQHQTAQHSPSQAHHHQQQHLQGQQPPLPPPHNNAAVIQNMMHNVLSQNSLMQLTNMAPILNPLQQHPSQLNNIHPPSSLQITPILNNQNPSLQSPTTSNVTHSPRMTSVHHQQNSPSMHHHSMASSTPNNSSSSNMSIVVTSSSIVVPTSASPTDDHCGVTGGNNGGAGNGGNAGNSIQPDSVVPTSQSNIMSSITISPTQPTFKMEHI